MTLVVSRYHFPIKIAIDGNPRSQGNPGGIPISKFDDVRNSNAVSLSLEVQEGCEEGNGMCMHIAQNAAAMSKFLRRSNIAEG